MMARTILIFIVMSISICARGQVYENAFHIGWNTLSPTSGKDFIDKTSSAGVRLGFTKFVSERFGFGVEAGYSTLNAYVPLRTYESPGGAITTDIYNYLYYFTVMGNAQYYFMQGEHFIPYASLGMGVAFSEYKIFYNVYQESDHNTGFAVRPEVGTLLRVRNNSSWGLKVAVSYDYAANKSDYFATDNLAGMNFLIGLVFLNR